MGLRSTQGECAAPRNTQKWGCHFSSDNMGGTSPHALWQVLMAHYASWSLGRVLKLTFRVNACALPMLMSGQGLERFSQVGREPGKQCRAVFSFFPGRTQGGAWCPLGEAVPVPGEEEAG